MGQRLGMAGILTLSGATGLADLRHTEVRPDYVISTIAELLPASVQGP
jgi:ribonucleotide monophosphatase NagD (HAD superfamily)